MKIVVEHTWGGDYEFGANHEIWCMEYDSCESLYCELEEAVKKYKQDYEEFQKKNQEWHEKNRQLLIRSKSKVKNKEKQEKREKKQAEEWDELRFNRPVAPQQTTNINGFDFDLSIFVEEMPEIKELNEWFDAKKEN